jgi:hypothetical protein
MTKKNLLAVAATLLVVFLLGCPQQKKIGEINQDPQRYVNKDIAVKGTVSNSFSALVSGAYELDDGTGKLWVLSNGGVPSKGTKVGVRGRIQTGFSFGGRSFGTILREEERRY